MYIAYTSIKTSRNATVEEIFN